MRASRRLDGSGSFLSSSTMARLSKMVNGSLTGQCSGSEKTAIAACASRFSAASVSSSRMARTLSRRSLQSRT